MKTILSILFAVLVTGCMSVQKAQNYLEKKNKLAEVCAKAYPVQDRIVVKETTKSDTVYQPSTKYIDTCNGSIIEKVCPPAQVITKTIMRDTTIYQRDRAYEQVQSDSIYLLNTINDKQSELIKGQEKEINKLKQDKRDWQWKAILTWIGIAGVIIILIFWRAKK